MEAGDRPVRGGAVGSVCRTRVEVADGRSRSYASRTCTSPSARSRSSRASTSRSSKGEVVVILGPSGSGKSTLLRCINRLEEPTGGQIFFEDIEITDPKTNINEMREHIGMVFQSFNLFPHLTAKGNVMLAQPNVLSAPRPRPRSIAHRAARRRAGRQGRLLPGAALRRPAAARRDRSRACDGPARDALRRGRPRRSTPSWCAASSTS